MTTKKRTFDAELAAAIGFRILDRRSVLKLTQRALSSKCSVSDGSIGFYELGTAIPTAGSVLSLCRALDMTPNELLGWEELP